MTSHGSILSRSFTQQGFNGYQAFLGNHRLPSVVADAVGEGVENAAGTVEGFFLG